MIANKEKYKIAVFLFNLDNHFHRQIIVYLKKIALKYNLEITFFCGRSINSPIDFERFHNDVYSFARSDYFNGLLLFSEAIAKSISIDEYKDFINSFAPIKSISVGSAEFGTPAVEIDNYQASKNEVNHFIKIHNKKKIAYISGPDNGESFERFRGYRDALLESNLVYNEQMVYRGDFSFSSGSKGVIELIDIRHIQFDALIAANDEMVYGALQELNNHNLKIPDDVAVAGYDDFEFAKFSDPPIASVHVPQFDQICLAVEMLITYIETGKLIGTPVLTPKFIPRTSCGCCTSPIHDFVIKQMDQNQFDLLTNITSEINSSSIVNSEAKILFVEIISSIVLLLKEDFSDPKECNYISEKFIKKHLRENTPNNLDLFAIYEILSIIEINCYKSFPSRESEDCIAKTFANLLIYSGNLYTSSSSSREIEVLKSIFNVSTIYGDLLPNEDFDYLIYSIFTSAISTGINSAQIALYTNSKERRYLNVFLSFMNGEIETVDKTKSYMVKELVDVLLKNNNWDCSVILPLTYRDENYGILLLEMNDLNTSIYENYRSQISNALKGTNLVQEQNSIEQKLSNAVKTLNEKNLQLQKNVETLKKVQQQIIDKEKNAALGSMVAGIAHEINTPLGICITSSSHLIERSNVILKKYENNLLKKSDFETHLATIEDSTEIILNNLNKSVNIIASFKQLAVDQSSSRIRFFQISNCIHDVLTALHPKIKKTPFKIIVNCSDTIVVENYPGALTKSLTELIENSLIHGLKDCKEGYISIDVSSTKKNAILKYSDSGRGIDKDLVSHIFQPFISSKRNEKMLGLGLTIVYNAISKEMQGSIQVNSKLKSGAGFTIIFPLKFVTSKE